MNVYLEHLKAERFLLEVEMKARADYGLNTHQQVEVRILYKRMDAIDEEIERIENNAWHSYNLLI